MRPWTAHGRGCLEWTSAGAERVCRRRGGTKRGPQVAGFPVRVFSRLTLRPGGRGPIGWHDATRRVGNGTWPATLSSQAAACSAIISPTSEHSSSPRATGGLARPTSCRGKLRSDLSPFLGRSPPPFFQPSPAYYTARPSATLPSRAFSLSPPATIHPFAAGIRRLNPD